MAVYPKLLLNAGGGIIIPHQQADQVRDTATILIGLGGTGVHCIRTIKTQVYTRLKPDDGEAVVPSYQHIRFIGVDSTEKSRDGVLLEDPTNDTRNADAIMALDDTEFFSVGMKHAERVFRNTLAFERRLEFSWLEYDKIEWPDLDNAGAGDIRQVGRFLMMAKSREFMSKVEQEINNARMGLIKHSVNVHIFSGLSGGTGSGCFLDVCYMIRSIAKTIPGVTIFGYFFMPDVNLSVIPIEDPNIRVMIKENGYAAMQELDYCMRLDKNGGSFEQVYQGNRTIKWDCAPVDMCHLICATDEDNNVILDAYNYALNVTAEYIMDFLTESNREFGLAEHLASFRARIIETNAAKKIGSETAYSVIGGSCAAIPLREINTYLASELFNKFGVISNNIPSKADIELLAVSALTPDAKDVCGIYESLYRELRDGAMGEYSQYKDDWKFVRDYGNSELVMHYINQTAVQRNRAEANAQSMVSLNNKESLLGRLRTQLADILRDIRLGPIFAYKMLDASKSHNFLNIIDDLITENISRWNQEAAQTELRERDYHQAKSDFENRRKRNLFDNNTKRFNDYEYYLMLLEQHKLTMHVYKKLDTVLHEFREQVVDVTATYYIKLSRVISTLIETFAVNRNILADQNALQARGSFALPLMTIEELKPSLDAEINNINIPSMLDAFMSLFLDNAEAWIMEDENKISKLVIDFFIETAFYDFADRTITSFLREKYENKYGGRVTDGELANYIYQDWMTLLTEKASPLFPFNNRIWSVGNTSKLAFLSFPSISAPIRAAAERMHEFNDLWGLKESALTDRIYTMSISRGLPMSSYNNCTEYERRYFSSKDVGRHSYEGKPNPSIEFTDWNKLPSITPQSLIDVESTPEALQRLISDARSLYAKARQYDVVDDDSYICEPDEESIAAMKNKCDLCESKLASTLKPGDLPELDEAVEALRQHETIKMVRTSFSFSTDGFRRDKETILNIQQDYFVSSPAIHGKVKSIISEIESVLSRKADLISAVNNKIEEITNNKKNV